LVSLVSIDVKTPLARTTPESKTAALERAAILFRLGRTDEIPAIAGEALAVFRSLGIEREALAALTLLRKAAERRELTLAVLESTLTTVRRATPRKAPRG